jgi:hypothetical protein
MSLKVHSQTPQKGFSPVTSLWNIYPDPLIGTAAGVHQPSLVSRTYWALMGGTLDMARGGNKGFLSPRAPPNPDVL